MDVVVTVLLYVTDNSSGGTFKRYCPKSVSEIVAVQGIFNIPMPGPQIIRKISYSRGTPFNLRKAGGEKVTPEIVFSVTSCFMIQSPSNPFVLKPLFNL